MATLDLKPLNKETIQKMGYSTNDLWVVKIEDDVFGPFEVESLKHYASENEIHFVSALASKMEHSDWQPFFSLAVFSGARKHGDEKTPMSQNGPFWMLTDGQKTGPVTRADLEKKIEMGLVGLNELVSYDDGHSWSKIYQLEVFSGKTLNSEELPDAPCESSFQRAKEGLIEKLKSQSAEGPSNSANLANLVFLGTKKDATRLINLDEIDLKSVRETEVSRSLKWLIPAMSGCMSIFVVTAYLLFKKPDVVATPAADDDEIITRKVVKKSRPMEESPNYRPAQGNRAPASIPTYDRSVLTRPATVHDTKYPEPQVETHEADRFPQNEPDPLVDPVVEADQPQDGQEPSLVNNNKAQNMDPNAETLDGTMSDATNNVSDEQPPQPVMEEATDF